MILSTLHRALPVSSGVAASTNVFNDIWATRDGEVPPGWPAEWARRGEELIIQRINLAPLFKQVILQNFYAPDQALYSVEDSGNNPVGLEGAQGYYIQGTLFTFRDTNSLLEAAGPPSAGPCRRPPLCSRIIPAPQMCSKLFRKMVSLTMNRPAGSLKIWKAGALVRWTRKCPRTCSWMSGTMRMPRQRHTSGGRGGHSELFGPLCRLGRRGLPHRRRPIPKLAKRTNRS